MAVSVDPADNLTCLLYVAILCSVLLLFRSIHLELSHVELVTMTMSDSQGLVFLGFCLLDVYLMFNYNLSHNVLICIFFFLM